MCRIVWVFNSERLRTWSFFYQNFRSDQLFKISIELETSKFSIILKIQTFNCLEMGQVFPIERLRFGLNGTWRIARPSSTLLEMDGKMKGDFFVCVWRRVGNNIATPISGFAFCSITCIRIVHDRWVYFLYSDKVIQ